MFINGLKKILALATFLMLAIASSTPCVAADKPVLIELFTSEGCSSCPAADEYLSTLRHGNKNIILIGEHVDYWNNLGWADPFSSSKSTERQRRYCQKLGANPYTPQAVINGARECVASNKSAVQDAISSFSSSNALAVPITIKIEEKFSDRLKISLVIGESSRTDDLNLYLVEDGVSVAVKRGENGGRLLHHDGVIRSQVTINNIKSGERTSTELPLSNIGGRSENFRIVAILEGGNGPVGATEQGLSLR